MIAKIILFTPWAHMENTSCLTSKGAIDRFEWTTPPKFGHKSLKLSITFFSSHFTHWMIRLRATLEPLIADSTYVSPGSK